MTKLLIIIPSLVGGGAERMLINLLSLIDRNEYEVHLVVTLKKGTYLDDVPEWVIVDYLFTSELSVRVLYKVHQKFNYFYPIKKKVKGILHNYYDCALSFIDGINTEALAFVNSEKKVSWVHGSYRSNINFYKFYRSSSYCQRLERNRYEGLDELVFVSHDALQEFETLFETKVEKRVIYNPINKLRVRAKAEEDIDIEVGQDKFVIVCVGSLLEVKNYAMLISACARLIQNGYNIEVLICGEGPLIEDLIQQTVQLGVENDIRFLGFLDNPYPVMAKANLFCMTSLSEALPTSLIEAMVLGIPTLATRVAGCKEVVADGKYGLCVDLNISEIAKGVISFYNDYKLCDYYSVKSLERARDFDDDGFIEDFKALIN